MQITGSPIDFSGIEFVPCPDNCEIHADVCGECGEPFIVPEIPMGWMWHMAEALYCLDCIRAGKVYKTND